MGPDSSLTPQGMQETAEYRKLLERELSRRIEKNSSYSLRAFARALNLDPASLSRVLSGKSIPSARMLKTLLSSLALDPEERGSFFSSVANAHKARKPQRLSPLFRKIEAPLKNESRDLSLDLFQSISDWYHTAILELTFEKEFQASPKWIASQLQITEAQAKLALNRLMNLGLLHKDSSNRLCKTNAFLATAEKELTTAAHRKRQRQVLEKAIASLENNPIEKRNHSAITLCLDPAKLPSAKKMIQNFSRRLCKYLESGDRKQVYELSVTLFPLQQERKNQK